VAALASVAPVALLADALSFVASGATLIFSIMCDLTTRILEALVASAP
jgi:hypothetical protein